MIQTTTKYLDSKFVLKPHVTKSKDQLLFNCVTSFKLSSEAKQLIGAEDDPQIRQEIEDASKPLVVTSVILQVNFANVYNLLSEDQKDDSAIKRTYWLGDGWNGTLEGTDKNISDYLVKSFAERIRRYKANLPIHHFTEFDKYEFAKNPISYEVSEDYQVWLHSNKPNAKYDFDLIDSFIKGEKIKPIKDRLFGTETDVITDDEIERIYLELKRTWEPKLALRTQNVNREERHNKSLVDVVSKLAEIQVSQLEKTPTKNTKKEE